MKNLYLIATRHNEGKTVLAFGLVSALAKKGKRIGYLKPIGHANQDFGEKRVDQDAVLMKEACALPVDAPDIAPVVLDGFPADWLPAKGREHAMERMQSGLEKVSAGREFVVIEGTGNASTGACFGLSAAQIVKKMDARVVLLASGGVAQPTDEVILNKGYLEREGVEVAGVVVNKVYPHEFQRLESFMKPVLHSMKLKLFGTIPHDQELSRPTLRLLLEQFRGSALHGEEHFNTKVGRFVLGAMNVAATLDQLQGHVTLICPSDREDLALAAMAVNAAKGMRLQGVIFAGKQIPSESVVALFRRTKVPVVYVELDAHSLSSIIQSTQYKLSLGDSEGLRRAGELVVKHVDIAALLEALK